MPFWPTEDIPYDRTVYLIVGRKRYELFTRELKPKEWTQLAQFAQCRVYVRKAK